MIDLTHYATLILADEDRPLFMDAVEAAKVDALRAAYVMIWLACAESLKRRFREAQKRDGAAGKIVGDIEGKEKDHRAVDKFVLDKAREYGFLSEPGHTVLNHVYEMRCIFGHPYEETPSKEQVSHAAAVVVEHVLSQPVKLRYGFGQQLLKSLLEDQSYLDDQRTAVSAFAKDIIPRLDDSIHIWLLDAYWTELEKVVDDSSMAVFFRRGTQFSRTMLTEVGVDVFSRNDWHDRVSKYPKTLMRVCSITTIFNEIGDRAQDSLVGAILSESSTRASVLKHLERLYDDEALSKRQQKRFRTHVARMNSSNLRSAGLSTLTCFEKIINALKTYNWYKQNPAVDLVVANGPDQVGELDQDQQADLGRNILQAADGNAESAMQFLIKLAEDGNAWPFGFLRGISLECFTNEDNQIRLKNKHLEYVLKALGDIDTKKRAEICNYIGESISVGTPKYERRIQLDIEDTLECITDYPWAKPIGHSLKAKLSELKAEEDDDES